MIRRAKLGKISPEAVDELKKLVKGAAPLMSQTNEVECDSPATCPLCEKPTINCSCTPAALAQWQRDEMFRLRKENEDLKITQADYHGGYVIYGDEKWWNEGVVNREREEAVDTWNDLISKLHVALSVPAEGLSADELVARVVALREACDAFESNSKEAADVFEELYAASLIPSGKPGPRLAEIVKKIIGENKKLHAQVADLEHSCSEFEQEIADLRERLGEE